MAIDALLKETVWLGSMFVHSWPFMAPLSYKTGAPELSHLVVFPTMGYPHDFSENWWIFPPADSHPLLTISWQKQK